MPEVWHRRVFTGDFAIGAGHRTANQRRHMDSVSARLASNDGAIGAHACQQDLGLRENVVVWGRSCIIPAGVPNPDGRRIPGLNTERVRMLELAANDTRRVLREYASRCRWAPRSCHRRI